MKYLEGIFSPELLQAAYEKACEVLEGHRIDIEEFKTSSAHTVEIEDALSTCDRLEEKWEEENTPEMKESKKWATVLEAMVVDLTTSGSWLGEDSIAMATTRPDDYFNGVDVIVESSLGEFFKAHLGLAIDATFANCFLEKLTKTRKEIDGESNENKPGEGQLATINYFKSEAMGIRGRKDDIPRVVVALEQSTIVQLAEIWLEEGRNDSTKESLDNHAIQLQIIEEFILQLACQKKRAEVKGQNKIAKKLNESLQKALCIYKERTKIVSHSEKETDSMFEVLLNSCQKIFLDDLGEQVDAASLFREAFASKEKKKGERKIIRC